MEWKKTHDNEYYIERFNKEVLNTLDILDVLNDLQNISHYELNEQIQTSICVSNEYHIALICYEKSEDFCHRHLVVNWMNKKGCNCEELDI